MCTSSRLYSVSVRPVFCPCPTAVSRTPETNVALISQAWPLRLLLLIFVLKIKQLVGLPEQGVAARCPARQLVASPSLVDPPIVDGVLQTA